MGRADRVAFPSANPRLAALAARGARPRSHRPARRCVARGMQGLDVQWPLVGPPGRSP